VRGARPPEILELLLELDHLELTPHREPLEPFELGQPLLLPGLLLGNGLLRLDLRGHVTGGGEHAEHVAVGIGEMSREAAGGHFPGLDRERHAAALERSVRGVDVLDLEDHLGAPRVPGLAEVASAVGAGTRLVACSHVSWVSGAFAPPELAQLDVPVVLDGAQGAGAVPVDVAELGCAAYAASGQKWLCGPDGTGYLYVAPALRERIAPLAPGYASLVDPARGLDVALRADARRYDAPATPAEAHAFALASLTVLEAATWPLVHARAAELAARLAELLRERGREVIPRGATTLVAWRSDAAAAEKAGLAGRDVVVRDLPGRGLLRASVGAWNDERDLERLLEALPA